MEKYQKIIKEHLKILIFICNRFKCTFFDDLGDYSKEKM